VGKTKRGKGSKIMAFSDGSSIPLALHTESASPQEVTLVEATLESSFLKEKPISGWWETELTTQIHSMRASKSRASR
jgi:hypothetical protein